MSYQPKTQEDFNEILNLLNFSIDSNEKCCYIMNRNISNIMSTLNRQTIILNDLYRYLNIRNINRVNYVAGQSILELNRATGVDYIPPTPTTNKSLIYNEPTPLPNNNNIIKITPKLPKDFFTINGIQGQWTIQNRRIYSKDGYDLSTILPFSINKIISNNKNFDRYSLNSVASKSYDYNEYKEIVSIKDYIIRDTSQGNDIAIIIYEIKDLSTGVIKTFEASPYHFKKYL